MPAMMALTAATGCRESRYRKKRKESRPKISTCSSRDESCYLARIWPMGGNALTRCRTPVGSARCPLGIEEIQSAVGYPLVDRPRGAFLNTGRQAQEHDPRHGVGRGQAWGGIRRIYNNALDLREIGTLQITRTSHVKPDAKRCWWADMEPVDGPVLGLFRSRGETLRTERQFLAARLHTEPATYPAPA